MLNNRKKGAMFGLDARIALAIFGALSVISGAALYSAIQDSKDTAILNQIKEVEKAIESYIIDTYTVPSNRMMMNDLLTNMNSVSTWKGPYINADYVTTSFNQQIKVSLLGTLAVSTVGLSGNASWDCSFSSGVSSGYSFYLHFGSATDSPTLNRDFCDGDIAEMRRLHDKFDSDGDYSDGEFVVIVNEQDATKAALGYRLNVLDRVAL